MVAVLGVTFGIAMFILMISFMQGVNKFLEDTNEDMPVGGIIMGHAETSDLQKQKLLKSIHKKALLNGPEKK